MAFRCMKLLKAIRGIPINRHNLYSNSVAVSVEKNNKHTEIRTEDNLVFYEDPDKFGTLSPRSNTDKVILEDEGDIKEEKFSTNLPLPSRKLTTRQYADLIKQYLKHKRLKEAINVLEVRMLEEDRVKPENYIYNILIGACAEVGYTKKAFKLFNEMKRRALKPTGDTYTCLFHACSNSPWPADGLKLAAHVRELMTDKAIEPNLTNYNSMIKAFGRCGDLPTAFKIVDEMVGKRMKIRVHTFNHLLQACISDKENGLRHALIVWRKMLWMREKPNIYSFNLMLKCVKDCNLGSRGDIEDLIAVLQEQTALEKSKPRPLQIGWAKPMIARPQDSNILPNAPTPTNPKNITQDSIKVQILNSSTESGTEMSVVEKTKKNSMHLVNKLPTKGKEVRTLPNLLSKVLQLQHVLSLQEVTKVHEKFAIVGGQDDFLKEMEVYAVKPDIKIFSQMIPLLEENMEVEDKLLITMKALDIKADIDFYNMLIKKRCLRLDYEAAISVLKLIKKEAKIRKRRFPDRKHLHLKPNIMTYGVLAMACKTKEDAGNFLNGMKDSQIKVNIEILGTLLRNGTAQMNFGYVLYIMNMVKDENLQPNPTFLKHLESFHEKCKGNSQGENGKPKCNEVFMKTYRIFSMAYKNWLKDINIEEVLKPEHPWAQFNQTYPETCQKQNINIKHPKKFYKRTRKYIKYKPTV